MANPHGAPKKPAPFKKVPCCIKMQEWLVDWTGSQDESRAVLIEEALIAHYKLKPPEIKIIVHENKKR